MKQYYHVSLKKNLESISKFGLISQVGERSEELNEEKGIYLFPTKDDMDCALGQWLGDWHNDNYGEEIPLMALEITLPESFPILDSTVDYEKISKVLIPPEYIKYLQDE